MYSFLDEIIRGKKEEVRALYAGKHARGVRSSAPRPFVNAIKGAEGLAIIAEVKKASPSKGIIAKEFDPVAIARRYEQGKATAISVLTEERYFLGSTTYLEAIREAVGLPVLRKDFIIDPVQVEQTAAINADAMLLIAAILSDEQMRELYSATLELSIEPLIEVHSMSEFERVLKLSPTPKSIGINNRNLHSFETDITVTLEIIKNIPKAITVISESGIAQTEQARTLFNAGVRGLLIGESLMRSNDPAALLGEFLLLKESSC